LKKAFVLLLFKTSPSKN